MQARLSTGSRGRGLILLVEDDLMAAESLTDVLETAGYAVRHAANGTDGLIAAEAERPNLVILDMHLPDSDGLMLIDRLRAAAGEKTAILLCSGAATQRDRTLALHLGADDVVGKPFEVDELLARVEALLRRYLPPPPSRGDHFDRTPCDAPRAVGAPPGPPRGERGWHADSSYPHRVPPAAGARLPGPGGSSAARRLPSACGARRRPVTAVPLTLRSSG